MNIYNGKTCKVFFLVLGMSCEMAYAMGSFYRDEGRALWDVILRDMMNNRLCANFQECSRLVSAYSDFDFNVGFKYYNLNGMRRDVLSSILLTVIDKGGRVAGGSPVVIEFYRKPYQYYVENPSEKKKPDFILEVKK